MISYKQRHAIWQKIAPKGLLLPIFIFGVIVFGIFTSTAHTGAATASTLNFQGRLLTSTGGIVADGSYNIEFKIYDSASSGASGAGVCSLDSSSDDCWWRETRTVNIQNGYFSVYLGDVTNGGTAFTANLPWDQDLWLTMNVNSDGEMNPRFKLTAVPYAFRAGALVDGSGNAKTAADFVQTAPSSIQAINSAIAALRLNQVGTGALLQLQGNGVDVFTVDNNGNGVLGAGITVGNSSSTTAGTIRWSGADLEVYDGSGWVSLTSGSGGGGGSANTASTFTSAAINVTGTSAAVATGLLTATNTTAISFTAGTTTGFVAPANGSFRSCLVVGNANRTGGSLTVRWRVNGVSVGSGVCVIDATNPRTSSSSIDPGVVTFNAGDTIMVVYETAGLTPSGSTEYTTYWTVEYESAAVSNYFSNGGNAFGGTATLGTTDTFGLTLRTDDVVRMSIAATGETTFTGSVSITSGGLDLNTTGLTNAGAISGVSSLDGSAGLTISSGSGADLVLDSASDILVLSDATLRRVASGTTTLDLVDPVSDTIFSIINSDGTYAAGLSVEGGVSAASFSGSGSGLTGLDGSSITLGTVDDARLSTNVTLLGNSFNGASQLVQLDGAGNLPALNGAALTNLDAANLTGVLPSLNASALTNLNASNISSGTLSDSLLSANVALLNGTQTYTGEQTFNGGLVVGGGGSAVAGTIRWNGVDLELYDGSGWVSLTGGGSSGPLSVAFIQAYDSTGGTDLNTGTPTAVPWDSETNKDTGFTHNNVTNNTRVYLDDAGWYRVSYNVSGINQSANRNTVFCQVRLNGTTYNTPSGSYSYTRDTTNAEATNTASVYIETTASNEYYEVLCSQAGTAGAQLAESGRSWTIAEKTITPTSGSGLSFEQGGNSFSGVATLGTSDTFGLNIITDGVSRMTVSATGNISLLGSVSITSGGLDLNTTGLTNAGAISGVSSLDGSAGLTISSGSGADLVLDSASDILVLSDATLRRVASGTTTLDLVDPVSDTIFSIINSDGTYAAGLSVEGGVSAASFSGSGSGLTGLDGSSITLGTVDDARLSTNVTLLGNSFNGASQLVQLDGAGTISDSLFSTNIPLLNGTQTFTGSSTFVSGGLVLGQTTLSSAATSAQNISLPDASGTICLSNSTDCGYLLFASGSYQIDSTTNDTIAINKTGASGNLIALQKNGGAVFTVSNTGALQIQNTGSTALDIRNVGGTSYFSVDTSTGAVRVGPSVADAVGVLFVLDTSTDLNDPTGTDGAIYYNSNRGKFRCYEEGNWKDCIGTRQIRSFVDTTADAAADNNTTNYWDTAVENNNSVPNISPSSTTKSVTGSVSFETQSATTADRSIVARVERSIGTPAACNSGTPVGTILSTFTTNNGEQASNTMTFLDTPNTTSTVYYTLCADNATSSAASMTINRIRITLEEANNSN